MILFISFGSSKGPSVLAIISAIVYPLSLKWLRQLHVMPCSLHAFGFRLGRILNTRIVASEAHHARRAQLVSQCQKTVVALPTHIVPPALWAGNLGGLAGRQASVSAAPILHRQHIHQCLQSVPCRRHRQRHCRRRCRRLNQLSRFRPVPYQLPFLHQCLQSVPCRRHRQRQCRRRCRRFSQLPRFHPALLLQMQSQSLSLSLLFARLLQELVQNQLMLTAAPLAICCQSRCGRATGHLAFARPRHHQRRRRQREHLCRLECQPQSRQRRPHLRLNPRWHLRLYRMRVR